MEAAFCRHSLILFKYLIRCNLQFIENLCCTFNSTTAGGHALFLLTVIAGGVAQRLLFKTCLKNLLAASLSRFLLSIQSNVLLELSIAR